MYPDGLVFGLLNASDQIRNTQLFEQLRNLTISWSRYGYRGRIIEAASVDAILHEAGAAGYRWCFIQSCGHMIGESWHPPHVESVPLEIALSHWIEKHEFLLTGVLSGDDGVDNQCMLVDLHHYRACGSPTVHDLIGAARRHGIAVHSFPPEIDSCRIYFDPTLCEQSPRFVQYLGSEIARLDGDDLGLGANCYRLLQSVRAQVSNARRGVFLWNVESYSDVTTPPEDFQPPVAAVYSVAAGFKPNMIVHSLGIDEQTRVVFFDYSEKALQIRKLIVDEWDGEDYPSFFRYVTKRYPHPDTFYQLWGDLTPDTITEVDIVQMWENEGRKWGGHHVIREHWRRYRKLAHEYVPCNLLGDRGHLLDRIGCERSAAIWWSNAFFTTLSNWLFTIDQRRAIYESWIRELAERNPAILLYGADFTNISVNHVRAAAYLKRLGDHGYDYLRPLKANTCEIRF
jgi:hypothetical protein